MKTGRASFEIRAFKGQAKRIAGTAFVLMTIGGLPSLAATVVSSVYANIAGGGQVCGTSDTELSFAMASLSCSKSVDGGYLGLAVAQSSASFSALRSYAFGELVLDGGLTNLPIQVSAVAALNDQIRLPRSYTEPIIVQIAATLDGVGSSGTMTLSWGNQPSCQRTIEGGDATCVLSAELFPGDTGMSMQLALNADVNFSLTGTNADSFVSSADYRNTARITGLNLFDLAMNPISGLTLLTDSGTDYSVPSNSTPEPGTVTLILISGLMSLAAVRRKHRL